MNISESTPMTPVKTIDNVYTKAKTLLTLLFSKLGSDSFTNVRHFLFVGIFLLAWFIGIVRAIFFDVMFFMYAIFTSIRYLYTVSGRASHITGEAIAQTTTDPLKTWVAYGTIMTFNTFLLTVFDYPMLTPIVDIVIIYGYYMFLTGAMDTETLTNCLLTLYQTNVGLIDTSVDCMKWYCMSTATSLEFVGKLAYGAFMKQKQI